MTDELAKSDASLAQARPVIPVVMVDQHFWESARLFNGNAFPQHVRWEATSCGDRLAILVHSVELLANEPGLDRGALLRTIKAHPSFEGFRPSPEKRAVLIFHNLDFVSGLYSALIALKSVLDLYSRLISRMLVPNSTLFGFNESTFRDRKIPGGRLLNWIERSAPTSFVNGPTLVGVFLQHLDGWLGEAIGLRDAVVHDGGIPGLVEATVALDHEPHRLQEEDITLPIMRGGEPVTEYCARLVHNIRILVSQTLVLFPDVDVRLLRLYEGDMRSAVMNDASE